MNPLIPMPFTQSEFALWISGQDDNTSMLRRLDQYFTDYLKALAGAADRMVPLLGKIGVEPSQLPSGPLEAAHVVYPSLKRLRDSPADLSCMEEALACMILVCRASEVDLDHWQVPLSVQSPAMVILPDPAVVALVRATSKVVMTVLYRFIQRHLHLDIREQAKAERQHHAPCKECPFARHVPVGCTGGSPPEVYVGQAMGPFALSCHMDPEYSQKGDPRDYLQCPGAGIFRANIGVGDLMPGALLHEPADTAVCFATAAELIAHHRQIPLTLAEEFLKQIPPEQLLRIEMEKASVKHYLVKQK